MQTIIKVIGFNFPARILNFNGSHITNEVAVERVYPIKIKKGRTAMKKKVIIFVLVGILVVFIIGTSIFFISRGTSALNKEKEYFDVYRLQTEQYIKSSPEILDKYGDDISVRFDNSITYKRSTKQGFVDKFLYIFSPDVPETIQEFSANIKMIKFNVTINGDEYEVILEKNHCGEFEVLRLHPS